MFLTYEDPYIMCWDLRNTSGIVYKLERLTKDTNQRIYFDIEPCGRHLGSGGQDGNIRIFDLQSGEQVTSFKAAEDTANGFCFHPSLPLAVTTSGHRRYTLDDEDSEEKNLSVFENCASVWSFSCSEVEVDIEGSSTENVCTYTTNNNVGVDPAQLVVDYE